MCVPHEGMLKELVLFRDPPVLHMYNVVEHGCAEWGSNQTEPDRHQPSAQPIIPVLHYYLLLTT